MAITGSVHIKVNTAVLNGKAQAVSKSIKNMSNCFDRLETIINRTSYYWIGEAGDAQRKMYRDQKPKIDEMMKRLKEHPADLMEIARTYESVEAEAASIATELPADVID